MGTTISAQADMAGRFALRNVPAGSATLRVLMMGYTRRTVAVSVLPGQTTVVEIALDAEPTLLQAITTESSSRERADFLNTVTIPPITLTPASREGLPRLGEADAVRVVTLLPGVNMRSDFSYGYNARGGESSQNLVLLDGIPLYNPFHLGGLFGTFIDAAVGNVTLHSSSMPTRYSGRLSSVLEVETLRQAHAGSSAVLDMSVVASSGKAGGAFDGGAGEWLIAARRTYADQVAALFSDQALPYHFADAHARIQHGFGSGWTMALTAFAGRDVLAPDLAQADDTVDAGASNGAYQFEWGNQAIGTTLTGRRAGDGGLLRDSVELIHRASISRFVATFDAGEGSEVNRNGVLDLRISGIGSVFGRRHVTSVGYEVVRHQIDHLSDSPETGVEFLRLRQRPVSMAVFGDHTWRLSHRFSVLSGLRLESLTEANWRGASPRLSARYFVDSATSLTASVGRTTQWIQPLGREDSPLRLYEFWVASDAAHEVSSAWQSVVAGEHWFSARRFVRVETFHKRYDHLLDYNVAEDRGVPGDEFVSGSGVSRGADLLLRQLESGAFSGWVAYTFAVNHRTVGGVRFAPAHDRRHDLNLVGTWRIARYNVGARFGYATGRPYTQMIGQIVRRTYDPSQDNWGTGGAEAWRESIGGPRNGARYPATQRLDLSVSRQYSWRGATIVPALSVLNAYNARNVWIYQDDYSTAPPDRRTFTQLPILPTFGVTVRH